MTLLWGSLESSLVCLQPQSLLCCSQGSWELLTFPCRISATWKYLQYTGCNLERWKHWIFFSGNWTPDWQEPHFESCSSGELWVLLSSIQNWTPKKRLMTSWGCHIGAVVRLWNPKKEYSDLICVKWSFQSPLFKTDLRAYKLTNYCRKHF